MNRSNQIRSRIILWLALITPLGFLFKLYPGPGHLWFNNYGAGLLYELFWILVVAALLPRRAAIHSIPIWVLVITSALEVLQLWHPWLLEEIRAYFLGRTLIGTYFNWWDFPHYVVGCWLGWLLLKQIHRSMIINNTTLLLYNCYHFPLQHAGGRVANAHVDKLSPMVIPFGQNHQLIPIVPSLTVGGRFFGTLLFN